VSLISGGTVVDIRKGVANIRKNIVDLRKLNPAAMITTSKKKRGSTASKRLAIATKMAPMASKV
jgi:hypothetical protein